MSCLSLCRKVQSLSSFFLPTFIKVTLREYIDEVKRRNAWKEELRLANLSAEERRPEEADLRKLDSSLKKNTAFIRKLASAKELSHS